MISHIVDVFALREVGEGQVPAASEQNLVVLTNHLLAVLLAQLKLTLELGQVNLQLFNLIPLGLFVTELVGGGAFNDVFDVVEGMVDVFDRFLKFIIGLTKAARLP